VKVVKSECIKTERVVFDTDACLAKKPGSSGFSMIVLHTIHLQGYAATINTTTKLRRSYR